MVISRSMLCIMAGLIVAGCGIQRPLMQPKDIPAYEESRRKRRERLMQEEEKATTTQYPAVEQK